MISFTKFKLLCNVLPTRASLLIFFTSKLCLKYFISLHIYPLKYSTIIHMCINLLINIQSFVLPVWIQILLYYSIVDFNSNGMQGLVYLGKSYHINHPSCSQYFTFMPVLFISTLLFFLSAFTVFLYNITVFIHGKHILNIFVWHKPQVILSFFFCYLKLTVYFLLWRKFTV